MPGISRLWTDQTISPVCSNNVCAHLTRIRVSSRTPENLGEFTNVVWVCSFGERQMGQTLFSRAHPSSQDVQGRNKATLGLACEKKPQTSKSWTGVS